MTREVGYYWVRLRGDAEPFIAWYEPDPLRPAATHLWFDGRDNPCGLSDDEIIVLSVRLICPHFDPPLDPLDYN